MTSYDALSVIAPSSTSSTSSTPASATPSAPLTDAERAAEREALVQRHLGLVYHVARRLHRRLVSTRTLDELVSSGTLGLLHAIDAFDPARGRAFSSFATPRIRGAILDDLREQDHAPRSVRPLARELDAARDALTAAAGRAPRDAELAAHLDIDVATLWARQQKVAGAAPVRLDAPSTPSAGGASPDATLELVTTAADAPDAALLREERSRVVREAILTLKEQQRAMLAMYYFEELQFPQIAQVFGVTQSRVSQIHKQALGHLREALRERLDLAA